MTQDAITKVLRDIYARVPKAWREGVVIKKPYTPTMLMVIDKALEDKDFPEEKKEQLKRLKEQGYFNKEQLSDDKAIVSKIDNFINREIKKAVKEGRLPNKKKLAELKELWKEQKKTS